MTGLKCRYFVDSFGCFPINIMMAEEEEESSLSSTFSSAVIRIREIMNFIHSIHGDVREADRFVAEAPKVGAARGREATEGSARGLS